MHPKLLEGLDRVQQEFRDDQRCLAMFLWGSAGKATADEFSDLDVAVVVRQDDYRTLKKEVPAVCERTFGRIVAWMPEGEQDEFVNYAFLFRADGDLLLCDLALVSENWITANPSWISQQVLFDRNGLLGELSARPQDKGDTFSALKLSRCLCDYWIYMYLNGKHFSRSSAFKIAYVQQALFERHLGLLRLAYPDLQWSGWSAGDVYLLPESQQKRLLIYSTGAQLDAVGGVLRREMDLFSEDAQQVCRRYGGEYTDELERDVREHLRRMNVT